MGYDQSTFPDTVTVKSTFLSFFQHSQTLYPWPLVPFFEISLNKTANSKPPTISFGIVASTICYNLSRNSIYVEPSLTQYQSRRFVCCLGLLLLPRVQNKKHFQLSFSALGTFQPCWQSYIYKITCYLDVKRLLSSSPYFNENWKKRAKQRANKMNAGGGHLCPET